jgi:acetyl-CoA synthetase
MLCILQANYLRSVGVKKGDAVSIYMPMVCELPIAMLACARIGAVHSVVFGGFSAEALAGGWTGHLGSFSWKCGLS